MVARKCDKCGKLYEYYISTEEIEGEEVKVNAISLANFNIRGDYCDSSYYDLCPDCMKELIEFISDSTSICKDEKIYRAKYIPDGLGGKIKIFPTYRVATCLNCGGKSDPKLPCCPYCKSTNSYVETIDDE